MWHQQKQSLTDNAQSDPCMVFYFADPTTKEVRVYLRESSVTDVADVGFLSGVSATVTLQDVLLSKRHGAQVALEGAVLSVDSHMLLQVRLLEETFTALITLGITNLWNIHKLYYHMKTLYPVT